MVVCLSEHEKGGAMRKRIICVAILAVLLLGVTIPGLAGAATSSCYSSRGVSGVAYLRNSFTWSYNSTKITAVDKYQTVSGLCTQKGGITKMASLSTDKKHAYNCTTIFLVGAKVGGVTLGYKQTWIDRIHISNIGTSTVTWNVK